jgi:hypothetical protein
MGIDSFAVLIVVYLSTYEIEQLTIIETYYIAELKPYYNVFKQRLFLSLRARV